jgi:hypothetical protein
MKNVQWDFMATDTWRREPSISAGPVWATSVTGMVNSAST